jgi:hypothetical protein
VIESERGTGKTTRLVDWAIEQAQLGEDVVFLCAFAQEVRHVTDLVVDTAGARGIPIRKRKRSHAVELSGLGTITVMFGDDSTCLRGSSAKVAADDWSEHKWFTRMYLHSWAAELRTEGG